MGGRRLLKAAALLATLGYCSLLAYQTTAGLSTLEARAPAPVSGITLDSAVNVSDANDAAQGSDITLNDVNDRPQRSYITSNDANDTPQGSDITLNDIFISVKTTRNYQNTRLPIILKTWFQLAKEQTWFFTDIDNRQHQNQTNGHMVNTNCSDSHQRKHLCCKMSVEYDHFLESGKKWFCHFDDDNYVNVPHLERTLRRYNPQDEWYLGRTSVYEPVKRYNRHTNELVFSFWFATGGAGFCLSRALALKMLPVASGGRFISICESIRYPDDVSMGFIVEHLMKRKLTVVNEFHSHLEQMKFIDAETFRDQISFGYSNLKGEWNVVQVPGFDTRYDPTRFLSLHCFLFPHFNFCPR